MRIEVASTLNKVRSAIAQTGKDIARGHSLKDENSVKRIINNPSSISPEDIEKYKQERLDDAAMSFDHTMLSVTVSLNSIFSATSNSDSFFKELKRQEILTLQQLVDEVRLDAQRKSQEWKL